jgi:ATPase subunit of ABC transporter with duplicated ATPase domains
MSVLDHVVSCDVERLELYKELEDKTNADTNDMEPEDKQELTERIIAINERL